jgi:hypothetical protein
MKLSEKVTETFLSLIHLVMTFIKIIIKIFLIKLYLLEMILNLKIRKEIQLIFQIKIHFKKHL